MSASAPNVPHVRDAAPTGPERALGLAAFCVVILTVSTSWGFRPVIHLVSTLVCLLGIGMLVPAMADYATGSPDWLAFVISAAATIGAGGAAWLATAGRIEPMGVRQTFLLTTLAWIVLSAFAALPFLWSDLRMSFTDAAYEAMSGLSTTGGTVIVGLDTAPPGILLWRALLNWFGGIGIIVMAIAILPVLRVGGMQLFRTESSDRGDKLFGSLRDLANAIGLVYLLLTVTSIVGFRLTGMNTFDAICHAMTSVSTGGFSTKDASLGWYGSLPVLWVATLSMIAGALPLTWYIRAVRPGRNRQLALADRQVRAFLTVLAISILILTLWAWVVVEMPLLHAFAHAAVNVTSIVTDTGFVSTDYSSWGSFAVAAFFFFYFVGGCTGSTSGSIKIFRWQVLIQATGTMMARMVQPNRVVVAVYSGKPVGDDVVGSVVAFVMAYIGCFVVLTLAMTSLGLDALSASSSIASALAGAGPGLGPIVGPSGTFAPLPDAGKWLLWIAMLLGRLEVFTALVLLSPAFWRR